MKRYFKHRAESEVGIGMAYIEFEDEGATRQVEVYNDRCFCSNRDYHPEIGPGLMDQPLSSLGLQSEHEISQEEFEKIWSKAQEMSS
jgi:hypothetical protein